MLKIIPVESEENLQRIRELFEEYASSLGFDLSFQNFEEELRTLPGEYAPPAGRLLIALVDSQIAGCVALRKISDDICEMKRLFVRPTFRGGGLGKKLALAIIAEARCAGYQKMRLDTVPAMKSAIALYESLGFNDIEPYRFNPIAGTRFMELDLSRKVYVQ
jgi:ribosomal protein S18 acetylase RimI-like enzyme